MPMKLVTGDTLARKEASAGSLVPWTVTSEHLPGREVVRRERRGSEQEGRA